MVDVSDTFIQSQVKEEEAEEENMQDGVSL